MLSRLKICQRKHWGRFEKSCGSINDSTNIIYIFYCFTFYLARDVSKDCAVYGNILDRCFNINESAIIWVWTMV